MLRRRASGRLVFAGRSPFFGFWARKESMSFLFERFSRVFTWKASVNHGIECT